jgi:glyoxylate carboligase
MTAAEAAIRMLESEGVDLVFGQPGAAILPFYQIASGQFQRVNHPRRYLVCGQAGPLGWEIPACIGAKLAEPEREVLAVVELGQALQKARALVREQSVPVVVEVITERVTNIAMGPEIAAQALRNAGIELLIGSGTPTGSAANTSRQKTPSQALAGSRGTNK